MGENSLFIDPFEESDNGHDKIQAKYRSILWKDVGWWTKAMKKLMENGHRILFLRAKYAYK